VSTHFAACPKCAHTPLPEDQSLPAACPACGLILAKFVPRAETAVRAASVPIRPADELGAAPSAFGEEPGLGQSWGERMAGWLLHVPDEVSRMYWSARIATLAVFVLWTWLIWRDTDIPAGEIGSNFLHLVLTPFHEAGHYLLFRWFGRFIMILGGTLGQHLMPTVLAGALLIKRRDPFGAALFIWLLGFSIIDMGVYMYDAYDPKLMLLSGRTGAESDGHDWQNIFGDLGLIRNARGIGLFFGWVGDAVMAAALAWGAWIIWLQHERLSDAVFAEEDIN
jgi:hypothetical protein